MTENNFFKEKLIIWNTLDRRNFEELEFLKIILPDKGNFESGLFNKCFDNVIDTVLGDFIRDSGDQDIARFRITEGTKTIFRSKSGLSASVRASPERKVSVDGKKLPVEGYTRIDFTPGGRADFDPRKMTDSLANGIRGLAELVAAIDKGEVVLEPLFIGTTNIRMALISQRLGFRIADSCRLPNGQVDKFRGGYTVVGRLEDIRQKLAEFAQKGLTERVLKREARLRRSPQPA